MQADAAIWTSDDHQFSCHLLCDFIFLPMGNGYLLLKCFSSGLLYSAVIITDYINF
jgi:hypothetical protein